MINDYFEKLKKIIFVFAKTRANLSESQPPLMVEGFLYLNYENR